MTTTTRSEKPDLRLKPGAKRTLQAAAAQSRSVSEFVIESALARAAEPPPTGNTPVSTPIYGQALS
jgi:uncharacterized protein (DUF1778 family)